MDARKITVRVAILSFGLALATGVFLAQSRGQSGRPGQPQARQPASGLFTKFIGTIQNGDSAAAIQLTHSHKAAVDELHATNPKMLWDKLTADLLQREMQALGEQGYWKQYAPALRRDDSVGGSPADVVRAAYMYFPKAATWKIAETRTEKVQEFLLFGGVHTPFFYTGTVAYATVSYPEEVSPAVNNRLLRKTVLAVAAHAGTTGIVSIRRLEEADEFWPITPITFEAASALARPYFQPQVEAGSDAHIGSDAYIKPPQSEDEWLIVQLPNVTGRGSAELESYFRRAGFQLRDWQIQPGWGANRGQVRPPDSWQKYERYERDVRGTRSIAYVLNETSDISLSQLDVKNDTATVLASVRRGGCNPVCQFVLGYYKLAVAGEITQDSSTRTNMFFRIYYPGYPAGRDDPRFPGGEDHVVEFQWSAQARPGERWSVSNRGVVPNTWKGWISQ